MGKSVPIPFSEATTVVAAHTCWVTAVDIEEDHTTPAAARVVLEEANGTNRIVINLAANESKNLDFGGRRFKGLSLAEKTGEFTGTVWVSVD